MINYFARVIDDIVRASKIEAEKIGAKLLVGTVETASPLSVRLDNDLLIQSDALVLSDDVRNARYSFEMTLVSPITVTTGAGGSPAHTHEVTIPHGTRFEVAAQELYGELSVGDRVLMVSVNANQGYYVLRRV